VLPEIIDQSFYECLVTASLGKRVFYCHYKGEVFLLAGARNFSFVIFFGGGGEFFTNIEQSRRNTISKTNYFK
jgi:hypothetical protein